MKEELLFETVFEIVLHILFNKYDDLTQKLLLFIFVLLIW